MVAERNLQATFIKLAFSHSSDPVGVWEHDLSWQAVVFDPLGGFSYNFVTQI